MDVHDPETRSYNMSQIRGKNTRPELIVRRYLHGLGFRYRLHDNNLPGSPDIVLPKHKVAIQIRGCFWHGHENCKYFKLPATRKEWWLEKIQKTKQRDIDGDRRISEMGWNLIEIWECELKKAVLKTTLESLPGRILKT